MYIVSMQRMTSPSGSLCIYSCYGSITWKVTCEVKISLSFSKRPLEVYMNTMYVMLSMRCNTRCFTSSDFSARSIAFWKTTLNACSNEERPGLNSPSELFLFNIFQ